MDVTAAGPLHFMGEAIAARLKLVFPPNQFTHEYVPARLTLTEWRRLTRRTPFVGLGWTGITPDHEAGRVFEGTAHWIVLLVTKNAGGVAARYQGDRVGAGLFQLIRAASIALQGFTPRQPELSWEAASTVLIRDIQSVYSDEWADDEAAVGMISLDVPYQEQISDDLVAALGQTPGSFGNVSITWAFGDTTLTDNYPMETS
jgi:hypothetical protein